jgi:hypothetical protein
MSARLGISFDSSAGRFDGDLGNVVQDKGIFVYVDEREDAELISEVSSNRCRMDPLRIGWFPGPEARGPGNWWRTAGLVTGCVGFPNPRARCSSRPG